MAQVNPTVTSIFFLNRGLRQGAPSPLCPLVVAHELGTEFVLEVQCDRSKWPSAPGLWISTAEFTQDTGWAHVSWRRLTIRELALVEDGSWGSTYHPGEGT